MVPPRQGVKTRTYLPREKAWREEPMYEEIVSATEEYETPEVETKLIVSRQCD